MFISKKSLSRRRPAAKVSYAVKDIVPVVKAEVPVKEEVKVEEEPVKEEVVAEKPKPRKSSGSKKAVEVPSPEVEESNKEEKTEE